MIILVSTTDDNFEFLSFFVRRAVAHRSYDFPSGRSFIGSGAPFCYGPSRHPFESEEVVVLLVSRVRDWKDSNLLLQKLLVLLSVFARELWRCRTVSPLCHDQTALGLRLCSNHKTSFSYMQFMLFMFGMACTRVHCLWSQSRCASPRVVTFLRYQC